ncbi:conserved Plasmodium protein, unknown function [Plasmodium knowlesi strain H]|uniref:Uncharacterized protein n=3 Tax=Plasmodium knowlesi TaxID=5850 RepID=A0A5K1VSA5_PLAKH|nr:conserved Plasmodium protein, unknown function [Plasmodium knowlesi strain H]OTN66052.1 Uncharacterized protein PKNOH_S100061600 [Plasmodium knowlesi]CAA9987969.1 conserved Plasmodium protein, unknown function [Plasmodium knowlesi strain H]SBO22133.1 conserved Plasmodium protein, unknown function [Plasmodium knowlesi strain H]SBO29174.1 conserved Plasmodium protein, unknown function [Plasmodium knowlesi strain H]VVS77443.1 conserved Plasmodium protein, unknown function [Plasmodium knowlesi |eukprot:XP_002258948.1 hypothetical protein, conserved in Plasmodium species [Plasmodium knowlesi strain H]
MKGVMRIKVTRGMHSLVTKTSESKLKKVKTYITSYHESTADPKSNNKYLGLLRNIYHTIPSRFNETEIWEHFLTKLKQERCFAKLKSIVNRNSVIYPHLLCRQIVFLFYIGLDDEANRLLDQVKRKLAKCEAEMFLECDAKVNEDMSDVIKMLYVLYHLGKTKENYKEVVLLCDKYIYNTKRDPLNNLKYLLYFHLFYSPMNHSFERMHKCIEMKRHRMNVEQMMLLIRYVNLYLKRLYLRGVIRHRGDRSSRITVIQAEITPQEGTHMTGSHPPCSRKKEVQTKVQNELDIFLGNLLRINKNEKEHYVFNTFDDIVINEGMMDRTCSPPSDPRSQLDRKSSDRNNPLLGEEGKAFHSQEDRDEEPTWKRGDPPLLDTYLVNGTTVGEITPVTERDLILYRDIYTACTNEVMKRVLIYKEPLGTDTLWNNFLMSMFRDKFINFMMDRMRSKMKVLNEEEFFTYLKQIKLLQIGEHPSVSSILQIFFKHYSIIQMKSLNNFLIADKMTYYTDIFCKCPFVQKYVLNMYRQNLNFFNVKILKKILAKLFYFLKEDKSLINGFDVLIKNIFVKVAMNGSFSDIVMVLHTLRQYNFHKNGVNNWHSGRRRDSWHDVISSPLGGPTLVYDEVRKKMLSFFAPISTMNNCDEEGMVPIREGDKLDTLFHLSAPRLDYIKRGGMSYNFANGRSEYHPICEYMMYRTVIEKMHLGKKLRYDKYFDLNIILMMNKQLAKLFLLFVINSFSTVRSGHSPLHVFDCVNKCVNEGENRVTRSLDRVKSTLYDREMIRAHETDQSDQSDHSGPSPSEMEFPFGDTLSVRFFTKENLWIHSQVLQTYAQKHPQEYAAVKRFGDLLLLTLIDNFLYFELKGSHFIHFFLKLFEENSWPLSTYHHFFFYGMFKSFKYSQISVRDRKCMREGRDSADDAVAGYLSSEEAFERRRQQIVGICREEIMWAMRRGLGVQGGERKNEIKVKGAGEENEVSKVNEGSNVDCLINLIFCHLQGEDIVDLFRNTFLSSLNDYLKWKGKDAVVKYTLIRDPREGTNSNRESVKERSDHHTSTILFNDIAKIKSLFSENGESEKMELQSAQMVRRYEFFYLNMLSTGRSSDVTLEDPFPTKADYLCYADFVFQRGEECSAQDMLRLARGVHKYGPSDQVGNLLKSIHSSWNTCIQMHVDCQLNDEVNVNPSGQSNLITFPISYLFLLTVSVKKILPEDVAPVLNKIDSALVNGVDIPPSWRLLLVQLIYMIKIQGLFSFDLLCSKYRQITLLYTRSIGQIRKERQRSRSTQCYRYGDNIWTHKIVNYLQDKKIHFQEEIHLVDSPFTFDVFIPSLNLFLLDGEKSLFCDTFVRCLQDNLFSHMDSKVIQVDEWCYKWLVTQISGSDEPMPIDMAVKGWAM